MFKIFVQTFNSYTNFIQNHLPNYVAKISGNGNAITGSTSFYQTNKGILVMTELQNVNDSFNFLGLKLKDTTCSASNENAENTALLAEYALDFAILAADRALLLSLKAIQEQTEAAKQYDAKREELS